jgi:hypothetical protein
MAAVCQPVRRRPGTIPVMRALVQRVTAATVDVEGERIAD